MLANIRQRCLVDDNPIQFSFLEGLLSSQLSHGNFHSFQEVFFILKHESVTPDGSYCQIVQSTLYSFYNITSSMCII